MFFKNSLNVLNEKEYLKEMNLSYDSSIALVCSNLLRGHPIPYYTQALFISDY